MLPKLTKQGLLVIALYTVDVRMYNGLITVYARMVIINVTACYLELIMSVFHCLRLDNWLL